MNIGKVSGYYVRDMAGCHCLFAFFVFGTGGPTWPRPGAQAVFLAGFSLQCFEYIVPWLFNTRKLALFDWVQTFYTLPVLFIVISGIKDITALQVLYKQSVAWRRNSPKIL